METINVKGMMCHGCERRVENAIKALGIENVKADHEKGIIEVELNGISLDDVKKVIVNTGFDL